MKKRDKIKYTDEPLGEVQIIKDFLPRIAKLKHTQYQKMIRRLLDQYAANFE